MPLVDRYGRLVNYLRICVTEECNFRCIYCHREGEPPSTGPPLEAEAIARVVEVAASLGVERVKLTGGEPLCRRGIEDVVSRIKSVKGIKEVSMTTNGYYLGRMAEELAEAGLDRVNVTVPSLDREKFAYITGVDALERVLEGVEEAVRVGLNPVKLNVPVLRGFNEDCIWELVEYASRVGASAVQLIEYHSPNPSSREFREFHTSLDSIVRELERRAVHKYERELQNRPVYVLEDGIKVEVVRPMFNPSFCAGCRKLRLTADGKLKPCFFRNDNLVDIRHLLDGSADPEGIKRAIVRAVELKKPYFEKEGEDGS